MLVLRQKYAYEYTATVTGAPAHIRLKDGRYLIFSYRGFMSPEEAKAQGARPVKMHVWGYSLDGGKEHPWVELKEKHVQAALIGKDVFVIVENGVPRVV